MTVADYITVDEVGEVVIWKRAEAMSQQMPAVVRCCSLLTGEGSRVLCAGGRSSRPFTHGTWNSRSVVISFSDYQSAWLRLWPSRFSSS